jgi:Tfp pilus assembly protein PilN
VFVCGDLAEVPDTWQSVVGGAGYSVSPLPSPVELPEGFNPHEFMVNIGLALKELLPEKGEANFSLVNFNALPQVYVPPRFSIARVLVPVGIVIGIGLIIFGAVFVQHNRAYTEDLRSQLESTQGSVTQKQGAIGILTTQAASLGAIAGELDGRITTMERGRAVFYQDLTQIVTLAAEKVTLSSVNHGGGSLSVNGVASDADSIFSYARDLRASRDAANALRFSQVWIKSISGSAGAFSFEFSLTK